MISLSRKTEYALIALAALARRPVGAITATGELARDYLIPPQLLAKVMHLLARDGVVRSHQGKKGGYSLAVDPRELTVRRVIEIVESSPNLVSCDETDPEPCPQLRVCPIRAPMQWLNSEVASLFEGVSLATIAGGGTLKSTTPTATSRSEESPHHGRH